MNVLNVYALKRGDAFDATFKSQNSIGTSLTISGLFIIRSLIAIFLQKKWIGWASLYFLPFIFIHRLELVPGALIVRGITTN